MMSTKENFHLSKCVDRKQRILFLKNEVSRRVVDIRSQLKKRSVHSSVVMNAAGLTYTGVDDTARGSACERQVLNLTKDLIPCSLVEAELLKEVRCRSFSHWPHRESPSSTQMILAGFFQCNVGDRVICLYCNLICQQWAPHIDDPSEVHQIISPQCPYVRFMLKNHQTSSVSILNESPKNNTRSNEIVYASACHPGYIQIPKRQASFACWPQEVLPSVDDLVRAGFFYTMGQKQL
jgi:hypothetical protein